MRPIDADALKASIEEKDRYNLGGTNRIIVCGMLDDAPTIDDEPVKHGNWCGYICSECNEYADYFISGGDFYFDEKPNFCPNCGAKMDGESE